MARLQLKDFVKGNTLRVRVTPNSKKTEITGVEDSTVLISIKAPAEKNKANAELIGFLRKELKMPCRIKSGMASRNKTILI